ncbi:hypothetical protein KY335_04685 [Candidatus Woesearchaeota archaeon]|nr:hypothetical protein [Candidatus Woesearchaeota archaeon]
MKTKTRNGDSKKQKIIPPADFGGKTNGSNVSLAIPQERIKAESDLRSEINNLEGQYKRTKAAYDDILKALGEIINEFREKMAQIQEHERRSLESYFPENEEKLLGWIALEGKALAKEGLSLLSPKDQELCKALFRSIAKIAHSDKDPEGNYADLFKEASNAYEKGDLFTLQLIKKELDTKVDVYSRRLDSTMDELIEERDALRRLLIQLNKQLKVFEFCGVNISNYLDKQLKLNLVSLKKSIKHALDLKLQSYGDVGIKKERVSQQPSNETALSVMEQEKTLTLMSDEEKEKFIVARLEKIAKRLDAITPYYNGFLSHPLYLEIKNDESRYAERLRVMKDVMTEIDIRRKENLSYDGSHLISFDAKLGRGGCYFFLYPDGKITIPESEKERYVEYMQLLNGFDDLLSKPIRVLEVTDLSLRYPEPILGYYGIYEYYDDHYKLTDRNEIVLQRLLQAMVLLKLPRIYPTKTVTKQYVFVEESYDSFPYDGSSGKKEKKDIVEMTVKDDSGKEQVVKGKIVEVEDIEFEEDQPFYKLLGSDYVEFEGYLDIKNQKIPFFMAYTSNNFRSLSSSVNSIKSGGFWLKMTINHKEVTIRYDQVPSSGKYVLTLNSIEEDLLPDLLFKIVERLRIEKVRGRNLNYDLEAFDYL